MGREFHHQHEGKSQQMTDDERRAIVSDGLLTVKEAQVFTGLSRSKLYQLMDERQLVYVRFGEDGRRAARRIPRRALVLFAAQHLVAGGG